MDVSRIGPISPQQIDWRRLTAKEIIKYEQQGVEVPNQYLQWAQEFRQSLETSDDTTYEMATSFPADTTVQPETPINTNTTTPTSSSPDTPYSEEEKTAAQSKREELQNGGVSLRNQARIFTSESDANSQSVLESAALISSIETQSVNEIQNLENYMNDLLSKAESVQAELKNEVAGINNDKGDKSAFGKINQLQQQLQQYGVEGQSSVSATEGDFSQYQSLINGQSGVILNAQDFGSETVGVGNDLLTSTKGYAFWRIIDFVIGKRAVSSGDGAISNSQTASEMQVQALGTTSDNISTASGYKGEIESRTGVSAAVSQSESSDNKGEETADGREKESEKTVKTAQNDGTDETAKASTNIDEILKRKIRKGENINTV